MQIWTWAPAIGWANHHIDNLTIFFLSIELNILKREYDEKKYGVLIKLDVSLELPKQWTANWFWFFNFSQK